MSTDPAAAAAELPCPNCGSKQATATPDEQNEYECRECGAEYDRIQLG